MEKSVDDIIAETLAGLKQATIAEMVHAVLGRGLPPEFVSIATNEAMAQRIRKWISKHTNDAGLKDFESIERPGKNGKAERVYVQLSLLDKEEHKEVVRYYADRATYYCRKTNTLVVEGNKRHHTKRQLPFPGFGTLTGDEAKSA